MKTMFKLSRYSNINIIVHGFLFFIIYLPHSFPARNMPQISPNDPLTELTAIITNNTWHDFLRFLDAGKGSQVNGMSELKKYFQRFGYLPDHQNLTDLFDESFESALLAYQKKLSLPVTGKLDSDTIHAVVSPRCGVSDTATVTAASHEHIHVTKHYAYFYGRPRWSSSRSSSDSNHVIRLTYAFSPTNMIQYISSSEIRDAFRRAFSRWSDVIPVNFTETKLYSTANIKIGFYKGDHGDGESFDGVLGVLAHAFSPENGRFHLDGDETWAVDFDTEKSRAAVDLESVATHEIGHILGLAHSSVKEAVMYPSLSPRTKKVDLKVDDVEGVQALYGSNPNFSYTSLLDQADISSSWGIKLQRRRSSKWTCIFFILTIAITHLRIL